MFFKRLTRIIRSEAGALLHHSQPQETFAPKSGGQDQLPPQSGPELRKQPDSDYYAMLELPYGVSFSQIKKQYRKLLGIYHPDRFANDQAKQKDAAEVTKRLNEAYDYFEKQNKR